MRRKVIVDNCKVLVLRKDQIGNIEKMKMEGKGMKAVVIDDEYRR